MMIMALGSCMLLLLVRTQPPRAPTKPAIAVGTAGVRAGPAD